MDALTAVDDFAVAFNATTEQAVENLTRCFQGMSECFVMADAAIRDMSLMVRRYAFWDTSGSTGGRHKKMARAYKIAFKRQWGT